MDPLAYLPACPSCGTLPLLFPCPLPHPIVLPFALPALPCPGCPPPAAVEYVRVLADERVAMVKYCSTEGARLAVGSLNGSEVLGEVLHVRHSPPLPLHARMTP